MPNKDFNMILEPLKAALHKKYSDITFDLWFANMTITSMNGKNITFIVPDTFKRDIVKTQYSPILSDMLQDILGFNAELTFIAAEETDLISKNRNIPHEDEEPEEDISEYKRRFHAEYTFENFVVGKSNELAQRSSLAVAKNPGELNNPLFLYGPSGIGKTHLLFAIMNETRKLYPKFKILYVTSEEFTIDYVDSAPNTPKKTMAAFRDKYRGVDMLLIDDVQFLEDKYSTQEEFFHTFNTLYTANKQMIIAADRHPREINNLGERLKSRFEAGLIADIQSPDLELRIAIFKRKANDMGISIPADVLIYLAENIKVNIRQIEGAIKKLKANSFISGKSIDLEMAKEVLGDTLRTAENDESTLDKIFKFIAVRYGVSKEQLRSAKRTIEIMFPRHVAIYLTRQLTKMPLKSIARQYGRKDHTSVMNSITVIENKMKEDPGFKRDIESMICEISSSIS